MTDKIQYSVSSLIKKARENLVFKGQLHLTKVKNSDSIDFWLEEEQIVVGAHKVRALTAYASYREWCTKKNLKPESIASVRAFSLRLRDLNFPYTERGSKVLYHLSKDLSAYEEKALLYQTGKKDKSSTKTKS